MRKGNGPPTNLRQWLEFCWLWLSSPTFRNSRNKRKAYYEHILAKGLSRHWS
jgi:hypothetical protein